MKGVIPWLVRWGGRAGTRDFCSALAALVGPVQYIKIFVSSPFTISITLSLSPSKLDRQPCWVACLLVCVSGPQVSFISQISKGLHVHSCTHQLRPRRPQPPPLLGSYTRALLVSQDRRHLFALASTLEQNTRRVEEGDRRRKNTKIQYIKPLLDNLYWPDLIRRQPFWFLIQPAKTAKPTKYSFSMMKQLAEPA